MKYFHYQFIVIQFKVSGTPCNFDKVFVLLN